MNRRTIVLAAWVVLLAATALNAADNSGTQTRELSGVVLTKSSEAPVKDAVVYLKNPKTLDIKTYITAENGLYRFPALPMNADYEIYAERNGKRSETKRLSSFDSRRQVSIALRIDVGK